MAASKQGQKAVICQLCEETFAVKWKCLTCQFFMCTKCCKIHEKFKSSDRHDIVNIKDGSTIQGVTDFSNIKCGLHNGQSYCLFCQKCEEPVCLSCVVKTHNTHKMLDCTEGNEFMLNELKERKIRLERENEYRTSDLKSLRENENSIYETEMKKIRDHSKVLKEAVDVQAEKHLDDLNQNWQEQGKSFREEENRLEVEKQEKMKRIEMLTTAIGSKNPCDVIKNLKREREMPTGQTGFLKFPKLPRFEAEGIATAKIISACGILKQSINFTFERVIQLKDINNTITNIVFNDDESVWITVRGSQILGKIDISSTSEAGKIQNTLCITVFDMAKTKDGDLLLSTRKPELRIIQKTIGKIRKSNIRVDDKHFTTAIHVTTDNKILVGVENYVVDSSNHEDRSFVQMMDESGEIEKIYEIDKDNRKLFSFPKRITSDDDNNISIMDILNRRQDGRIVTLSRSGEVKGIYSGHPENYKRWHLKPSNIVSTKCGRIIVSESGNHLLHILNTKGECIQYQDTKELGIHFPLAMDLVEDNLLICCRSNGMWENEKRIWVHKLS